MKRLMFRYKKDRTDKTAAIHSLVFFNTYAVLPQDIFLKVTVMLIEYVSYPLHSQNMPHEIISSKYDIYQHDSK